MSNDYESTAWADHHHHVSAGFAHLLKQVLHAFKRLNAIEYDAPWERQRPCGNTCR
jgi:hypothetical protein